MGWRRTANIKDGALEGYDNNLSPHARLPLKRRYANVQNRFGGKYNHLATKSNAFFGFISISGISGGAVLPFNPIRANVNRRLSENYNDRVARGWESKSVEAQQAEASDKSAKPRPRMSAEEAARWRERESLRLSRQRVLQQLEVSQNPRHRKLLEEALADLEERLKK